MRTNDIIRCLSNEAPADIAAAPPADGGSGETGGTGVETGGTSGGTGGTSGETGGTGGETGGTSGETGGASGETGGTSGEAGGTGVETDGTSGETGGTSGGGTTAGSSGGSSSVNDKKEIVITGEGDSSASGIKHWWKLWDTQNEASDGQAGGGDGSKTVNGLPLLGQEVGISESDGAGNGKADGLGFWPGLFIGALLGVLLWCLLKLLLNKLRPSSKQRWCGQRCPEIATAQGLGAREDQQDTIYASDPELYRKQGVLLCVADGMGGLKNGAQFSRTAVLEAARTFEAFDKSDPERLIVSVIKNANSAVNAALSPNYGSGGTTLLLGLVSCGEFYYASIGDSRICLYRNGELIQLNRPHIYEDELLLLHINGGMGYDEAKTFQKRGALTSYLGMGTLKYADMPSSHVPIHNGDRIILMSDGVFNTLSEEEIVNVIQANPQTIGSSLEKAVERKRNPYQDNYSAIVLAV